MRCEGMTRYGGAFTMGRPEWVQCEKEAIFNLTVKQDGKVNTFPSCTDCLNKAIKNNIEIIEVTEIKN